MWSHKNKKLTVVAVLQKYDVAPAVIGFVNNA